MKPDGISVVELDLNLSNTWYYLCWTPATVHSGVEKRRLHPDSAQVVGSRLGWLITALCGPPVTDDCHLLFGTTTANLDYGLNLLVDTALRYRLYLVQPGGSVRQAARYVRSLSEPGHHAPARRPDAVGRLPEIHHDLFIGERTWAEQMLTRLACSGSETTSGPRPRGSLGDIAKHCSGRKEAIVEAYRSSHFSLKDIAEFFDMHFSEISAIINTAETGGPQGKRHSG